MGTRTLFDSLTPPDRLLIGHYFAGKFERVNFTLQEIFDATTYSHFSAVSFVSSAKLFSDITEKFQSVKFVLGIPDAANARKFEKTISKNSSLSRLTRNEEAVATEFIFPLNLLNSLSEKCLNNYINKNLQIRYTSAITEQGQTPIMAHSKIYCLFNADKTKTRVIIGSANFTAPALQVRRQFENIAIFDDFPDFFNVHCAEIDAIYNSCNDILTPSEFALFKKNRTLIVDDAGVINHITAVARHEANNGRTVLHYDEPEQDAEEYAIKIAPASLKELSKQLLITDSKHVSSQPTINIGRFEKKKEELKNVLAHNLPETHNDLDQKLTARAYFDASNRLVHSVADCHGSAERLITAEQPIEKIKAQLQLIDDYFSTYDSYSANTTQEQLELKKRGMEVILYSFMSPFISLVRKEIKTKYRISEWGKACPIILALGGTPGSGKTNLMTFVYKLLGFSVLPRYDHLHAEKISIIQNKKKETIPMHSAYMLERANSYPLVMDEVKRDFYNNTQSRMHGVEYIKNITDTLEYPHACIIGTTNCVQFNVAVKERIYFIGYRNSFKENINRQEKMKTIGALFSKVDPSLFCAFANELYQYMYGDDPCCFEQNCSLYENNDFLYAARIVMKKLYSLAELPVPDYFPETIFSDDFRETGRRIWQNYYEHFKTETFNKKLDDPEKMTIDQAIILGGINPSKLWDAVIGYIPQECIIDIDSRLITVYTQKFLQFIERDARISSIHPTTDAAAEDVVEFWRRFYNDTKNIIFSNSGKSVPIYVSDLASRNNIINYQMAIDKLPRQIIESKNTSNVTVKKKEFLAYIGLKTGLRSLFS